MKVGQLKEFLKDIDDDIPIDYVWDVGLQPYYYDGRCREISHDENGDLHINYPIGPNGQKLRIFQWDPFDAIAEQVEGNYEEALKYLTFDKSYHNNKNGDIERARKQLKRACEEELKIIQEIENYNRYEQLCFDFAKYDSQEKPYWWMKRLMNKLKRIVRF